MRSVQQGGALGTCIRNRSLILHLLVHWLPIANQPQTSVFKVLYHAQCPPQHPTSTTEANLHHLNAHHTPSAHHQPPMPTTASNNHHRSQNPPSALNAHHTSSAHHHTQCPPQLPSSATSSQYSPHHAMCITSHQRSPSLTSPGQKPKK